MAAFGSFAATGLKGLGNLNGDGLGGLGGDPLGSTSCTTVHFGDIDALAEAGCFLRDPRNPTSGAAVIAGEIRLNGLEIIPDAGVEIAIDPAPAHDQHHRLGARRAPVAHGRRHHPLPRRAAPRSRRLAGRRRPDAVRRRHATTARAGGLPVDGRIDVQIEHDSVVIPVFAEAPGVHGRRHRAGDAAGQQCDRPAALLAAHRGARSGPRRIGDQGPDDRLHRDGRRLGRQRDAQHPGRAPRTSGSRSRCGSTTATSRWARSTSTCRSRACRSSPTPTSTGSAAASTSTPTSRRFFGSVIDRRDPARPAQLHDRRDRHRLDHVHQRRPGRRRSRRDGHGPRLFDRQRQAHLPDQRLLRGRRQRRHRPLRSPSCRPDCKRSSTSRPSSSPPTANGYLPVGGYRDRLRARRSSPRSGSPPAALTSASTPASPTRGAARRASRSGSAAATSPRT